MTYRAFVSSTWVDLKLHRAHVIRSLRRAGFFVDPMEDWTADNDEPKKFSQERLEGCDLCILLVAFRRGTVPDGETLSITQLEYHAAVQQSVHVLPFMLEEDAPWPRSYDELDKDPELIRWRKDLRQRHGVEPFGLEPHSIDMTGALGRWLSKKNSGANPPSAVERIDWPDGKSPYPGLMSFDQEYAHLYFGREREVNDIIAKMSEPEGRFVVISGDSGSGKSSLVGAGVWRALIQEDRIPGSREWQWLRIQPGDGKTTPFEALAWGLKQTPLRFAQRPEKLAEDLAAQPRRLGTMLGEQLSGDKELLLFIDQLEELFTQGFADQDIRNFLEQLVATTRDKKSRLRVIASLRGEFISRLVESDSVRTLLNAGYNFLLGPVSPKVLPDMIEKPAQVTGYDFEPELIDDILRDAAQEPGSLPLVAYALKQLYERRRDRTFTRDAYKEIEGVAGSIGMQADQVIAGLAAEALAAFDRVFAELVYIERDRPPSRKRCPRVLFKADSRAQNLIDALTAPDCRIMVSGGDARDSTVEVAHEKLFTAWPRLKEWIDKGGEALRLIEHATEAAQRWHQFGENPQELWPATRAVEVLDALKRFEKKASLVLDSFLRPQQVLIEQLDQNQMSHQQRELIGQKLAELGDPRPGVGLRSDGLPDIEWVDIPAGKVRIEGVKREFNVKPFRIAKYLVTNMQFEAFINAEDGYKNKQWWTGIEQSESPSRPSWIEDNCPRETVSWYAAVAFCRWLSKQLGLNIRLPTEWEWQQAATGGDAKREYPWEGGWDAARCNSYESRLNRTSAAGVYPNGATKQGVLDMAGNVGEWCLNKYEQAEKEDAVRIDDSDTERVFRGGSWNDEAEDSRASYRNMDDAGFRYNNIGFRLAQELE